jgi:anaphase-promoting complex subunit 11
MPRVEIQSWMAVATWEWDISDPHCAICLNEFEMPCNRCQFGGDDCSTVQGTCGHNFHMHCIYSWRDQQAQANNDGASNCPNCRAPWEEARRA